MAQEVTSCIQSTAIIQRDSSITFLYVVHQAIHVNVISLCIYWLQLYLGAYHQVHNEPDGKGDEAMSDIANWIIEILGNK